MLLVIGQDWSHGLNSLEGKGRFDMDDGWFKSAWLSKVNPESSPDAPVYVAWDMGSPDGDAHVEWSPRPGGGIIIHKVTYGGRQSGRSHLRLVHSRA